MSFVSLQTLLDVRSDARALRGTLFTVLDDAPSIRAISTVILRLDGFITAARARRPQGLMTEEIQAHDDEPPWADEPDDPHPSQRTLDRDGEDF